MHARTVRSEGSPDAYEKTRELLESQALPQLKQYPGFQGAYWAGDRAAGKGIGVFFYASEQHLRETSERAGQLRSAVAEAAGGRITEVKEHEVVADTGEKVHTTATHARVTTIKIDPSRRSEGIERIKNTVIPTAQGFPGFLGGFWLATTDGQESLGCTLWDSKESLEGSRAMADQLRQSSTQATGSQIQSVEEFEIVARAETPVGSTT